MTMPHQGFTPEQIAALSAPLDRACVKIRDNRPQPKQTEFHYVEGWHVIAEANRIFGFGCWTRELLDLRCVCERERGQGKPGWIVGYLATVRITVTLPDGSKIFRDGTGSGEGIDGTSLPKAHEKAAKEAETDAMKRAFSTFGNVFGLALYDKEQRNVADEPPAPPPADLLAMATAVCRQAGLTDLGISAFAARLTGGESEELALVPLETLRAIVGRGPRAFSAETIAACNGDETP